MTVLLDERNGRRGPAPGTASPRQAVATATAAWVPLPDWVLTLAEACDASSQTRVAKQLKYSGSVVSAILNRAYKGNSAAVEQAVRGVLMAEELDCPALGPLPKHECLDHQKRARTFAATSTHRVRMFRACRGGCVHSRLTQTIGATPNAQ